MEVNISGFDQAMDAFDDILSGSGRAVNAALKDAGLIVSRNTKRAIHKAADRGYATGELERSVYSTNAKKNDLGSYVVVKPAGTDSKGVRNGAKWGYLLHGNGRGSEKRDFKTDAIKASEKDVVETIEKAMNKLVQKLEV